MTNPYAAPEGKVEDFQKKSRRGPGVALWIPSFLYVLHALLFFALLSLMIITVQVDGGHPNVRYLYASPLLLIPLSSLAAGVLLFLRKRKAVIAAVACPVLIGVHFAYIHARLSYWYFVPACIAAIYVVLLWLLKKIR